MPGLDDYRVGQWLHSQDLPFYALIQAAMRKADTANMARLEAAFPAEAADLRQRYDAPGGMLPAELADRRDGRPA